MSQGNWNKTTTTRTGAAKMSAGTQKAPAAGNKPAASQKADWNAAGASRPAKSAPASGMQRMPAAPSGVPMVARPSRSGTLGDGVAPAAAKPAAKPAAKAPAPAAKRKGTFGK